MTNNDELSRTATAGRAPWRVPRSRIASSSAFRAQAWYSSRFDRCDDRSAHRNIIWRQAPDVPPSRWLGGGRVGVLGAALRNFVGGWLRVLQKEAQHLAAGVWTSRIGVRSVGAAP